MLTATFLPYLKLYLKHCGWLHCIPYSWGDGEVTLNKSRKTLIIMKGIMVTQVIYLSLQIPFTLKSPYSLGRKLEGMVFSSVYTVGVLINWNFPPNFTPIRVLNAFLRYEKSFFSGNSCSFYLLGWKNLQISRDV